MGNWAIGFSPQPGRAHRFVFGAGFCRFAATAQRAARHSHAAAHPALTVIPEFYDFEREDWGSEQVEGWGLSEEDRPLGVCACHTLKVTTLIGDHHGHV